jgi:hypothetical protein
VVLALLLAACERRPPNCRADQYYSAPINTCVGLGADSGTVPDSDHDADAVFAEHRVDDGASGDADAPDADVARDVTMHDADVDSGELVDPSLVPPRQISPLSTSSVSSVRPTLRWTNTARADGAVVELSRTRGFETIDRRFRVVGENARVPTDLPSGVWFWRLRSAAISGAVGQVAGTAWWFRVGAESGVDTSSGVEPDFDGDGLSDVVVGAPYAMSNAGRVALYFGSRSDIAIAPDVVLAGEASSSFGLVVASAGDINGDGIADLVVGAPGAWTGANFGAGMAAVYFGSATRVIDTPARLIRGTASTEQLGASVAAVGDVNGDGYGDVAIGSPNASASGRARSGVVAIYAGGPSGLSEVPIQTFVGTVADQRLGVALSGAFDCNGDRHPDLLMSSSETSTSGMTLAGSVQLHLGSGSRFATDVAWSFDGAAGDNLGRAVAGVGDLNRDGLSDVMIGAPMAAPRGLAAAGRAALFWGSPRGLQVTPARVFEGAANNERLGSVVARLGDVNNDGFDDAAFSLPYATAGGRASVGVVEVLMGGGDVTSAATLRIVGASADEWFGLAVGQAGDVNGDGFCDMRVGSPNAAPGGRARAGVITILFGSAGGVRVAGSRQIAGAAVDDRLGGVLASLRPRLADSERCL